MFSEDFWMQALTKGASFSFRYAFRRDATTKQLLCKAIVRFDLGEIANHYVFVVISEDQLLENVVGTTDIREGCPLVYSFMTYQAEADVYYFFPEDSITSATIPFKREELPYDSVIVFAKEKQHFVEFMAKLKRGEKPLGMDAQEFNSQVNIDFEAGKFNLPFNQAPIYVLPDGSKWQQLYLKLLKATVAKKTPSI
jgi:hypothetical protein